MDTIKIKPTDPKSQGPVVIINRDDFDPAKHVMIKDDGDVWPKPGKPGKRKGR